ncbi:PadR family transcriptional regulator [Infirmifilum lucidum]|uniref:PadR family transcriptional regulator n=1 Tax=Infirmifilum lucidum TaxID=2776706 RepID=A0A7L9FFV5_9CREN|nr:PadR family transcriptional regulator [Infirmifilum lucidum]QOJ78491.1 PadR family transcriptional regulator [Infirmifilum lucidum]
MPRSKNSGDVGSLRVNTVIKLYTLILLAEGEKHGYELMRLLEKMLGAQVGPSQVYPYLKKVEEAGLVESREVGSRDKKTYRLTPEGVEFVRDLLERSLSVIQTAVKVLGREKVCLP